MSFDNCALDITYRCNNNCSFCYSWNKFKDEKDFLAITKELISSRKKWAESLNLSWWEPTLHQDLEKVIKLSKKLKYNSIEIITNWRKLSDKAYLDNLLDVWLNRITVSIHWKDSFSHDKITWVKWSFDETMTWIGNILESKKSHNLDFGINISVCDKNKDGFQELFSKIMEFAPSHINIHFVVDIWKVKPWEFDFPGIIRYLSGLPQDVKNKIRFFHIPFCFAEGMEDRVICDYDERYWDVFPDLEWFRPYSYVKIDRCLDCKFASKCPWVIC